MPKEKVPLLQLKEYIPDGSFEGVMEYLTRYKVQLTVTRQRESILGDYRHAHAGQNHRISVNGNLNQYAFLITLLHELAHLFTYERYGHRVQAHGAEWKASFGAVLARFLSHNIFPDDIAAALGKSLHNPAASSCADEHLLRVLKKYDPVKEGFFLLEQLPPKSIFMIKGQRVFEKGERVRKRYKCKEIATGKLYLFSPVYEVKLLSS
ncbi:MAG: SprT-like domain-containing protein [Ferruginibacter sp.]